MQCSALWRLNFLRGSNPSLVRYPLLQGSHFWSCKKSLQADAILSYITTEICCSNLHPKANCERYIWDWLYLPSWRAALCTIFCSSAVSIQPWGSLQQNWSLILLRQGRSLIKPLKRRAKKVCLIFSSMRVTTALRKSVRKEVKKVGRHALSTTSAAPQACEKGISSVLW